MRKIFKNLSLIDVKAEEVIEDGLIIVENGRIEYAGDFNRGLF